MRSWVERAREEPTEWYNAAVLSEHPLLVTAAELQEINKTVRDLLDKYRRRERRGRAPEGARAVTVQYRSLPIE